MKKRAVQVLFVSMILGLLAFSAMNFLATSALAGPGVDPPTDEIKGRWVSDPTCPTGWTCVLSSEITCWCAGTWRGCCI